MRTALLDRWIWSTVLCKRYYMMDCCNSHTWRIYQSWLFTHIYKFICYWLGYLSIVMGRTDEVLSYDRIPSSTCRILDHDRKSLPKIRPLSEHWLSKSPPFAASLSLIFKNKPWGRDSLKVLSPNVITLAPIDFGADDDCCRLLTVIHCHTFAFKFVHKLGMAEPRKAILHE